MQFSPDQLLRTIVSDQSGTKVGKVQQVYLNDATGEPSWVTVRTGIFGTNESLVPLDNARLDKDLLQVPFDKQVIQDAPNYDPGHHLDETDEDDLYRYYGLTSTDTATAGGSGREHEGRGPEGRGHEGREREDLDRAGQTQGDHPSGEYVSGTATAGDRDRAGGREQAGGRGPFESGSGERVQRDEQATAGSTGASPERDLLKRERDLLDRERELLDRERDLAEQEGLVRPRLRRHEPGNPG